VHRDKEEVSLPLLKNKKIMLGAVFFSMLLQSSTVFAQEQKWYEENRLVAHALGSVGDKKETNSKEAFLESWGNGIRAMEADFSMTSDGTLVVRHDFDQDSYYTLEQKVVGGTAMTIDRYLTEKINFRYTPLTAAQLIQLITEYNDVYLITDTKNTDTETVQKQFTALVNAAKAVENPEVLERIVVQIYNPQMYDTIKAIYPFTNWIYTLYQTPNPNYAEIGDFCVANGIDVVTINQDIVAANNISVLTQKGIKVYAHTVNRILDLQKMLNAGVYGVYTDYIKPRDLSFVGLQAVNRQKEVQLKYGDSTRQVTGYSLLGKDYVSLRDIAILLKGTEDGFAVSFDRNAKTILLQQGQEFVGMGNELLLGKETKQYVEKCNYVLQSAKVKRESVGFFVDGELYYEPQTIAATLGLQAEEQEGTILFQKVQADKK
jgi:glycerophosphoryl diester phosphodiesterase